MAIRNPKGQFIESWNPDDVAGPRTNPDVNQVLKKYGFKINDSTCVADVTYDLETESLTIEFQKRGTYKYSDVPLQDFLDFQSAASRGTYFNLYIRTAYAYERIS
jgi:hypothetical protein